MRLAIRFSNLIALPLAFAYSEEMPGDMESGTEFAVIIGPIDISIMWG